MPNQDPYDFSDRYNTQLSPEEEAVFLQEMGNKLGDLYDYDMRGAWRELKNGTMSKDKDGHLGDRYKKPNHMTFSTESIYNGVDGYNGGTWSKDDTGAYIYTPTQDSMYSDAQREHYWITGDELKRGTHLNSADGRRLITGANADVRAGLAAYPQNAHNPVLSEGNGLVDLGHGVLAEILPDGSTVTYRGISGEDLVEARRDVRQSPLPEESGFLDIISKLGGLINGGRNVPSSPPTLPSGEYIDSSGQRQYMLTGIGPRG